MADRWQKVHPHGEKQATRLQIERVCGRQLQLVTRAQLLAAGVTSRVVGTWADQRRLFRLHRGVYATHPPPYSRRQRWLAAVLACGRDAFLCGPSCAEHLGVAEIPSPTAHVCSPSRAGRSRPGITVHHRRVDPRDARIVEGIPCVSADLVLLDLAPALDEADLEVALVAAESLGILKRGRLAELVAANEGKPGVPKLASLLALEPALTKSELERVALPICRRAGVERPLVNLPISVPSRKKPLIVDLAWPDIRMVVEADSQRFHGDWERAAVDRERDQLLALAGWRCHRFVRSRLVGDPSASAERLAELTTARIAELGAAARVSA